MMLMMLIMLIMLIMLMIDKKLNYIILYTEIYKAINYIYSIITTNITMLYDVLIQIYEYILVKLFPDYFEYKIIERVNSTGSFVEFGD